MTILTLAAPTLICRPAHATLRFHPLRDLALISLGLLLFWTLTRGLLLGLYADRVAATGAWGSILWTGLRVDLISLGWMLSLPILLLPLAALGRPGGQVWTRLTRAWWVAAGLTLLTLELATPSFLAEYQARPNHLALEYLKDLREILPMLWNGFRLPLLLGVALWAGGTLAGLRWVLAPVASGLGLRWRLLLIWPLLLVATVLMIRGSLDHRPANPALFARWNDGLINELALNSGYRFGYAVYAQKHERSAEAIYGGRSEIAVRDFLAMDVRFAEAPAAAPTRHRQVATTPRATPLNLIIVVLESQGADFSGRLSGQGFTPQLDRWASRGWWFERLYATGTRSARGLEAIVAGFPPSPAPAVLKREGAQSGFTTLASVLATQGYDNQFIYGGGSHFDNMRGFFQGNGFDSVIDRDDYVNPHHTGSWGVSDEDLFDRALAETAALHDRDQAFFKLVFTSSNHTPFDFPPDRLPPDAAVTGTVEGAVRYADFALGRFLDTAATQPWFANTLIMVVADHDVRMYGDDVIPLRRFQIPGLLVGADIAPQTITSLASQIDLAPTLLSVMGVSATVPFPGRDLSSTLPEFGIAGGPVPRAILQFDNRHGWLEDDTLDVLHPGGHAERWAVQGNTLSGPSTPPEAATATLKGSAQLGDWLYRAAAYGPSASP
ncbi:LTA synthase family protein [Polycyclovorans algicola]|uniref:LTA synthase family protein n=1 Tax=Polycyclovorans algicola TaxID=616992 RepID=UPI0006934DA1|nr:LTA synthase family protein [Polycyclovorans algicola]